jgi:hypothetical protein
VNVSTSGNPTLIVTPAPVTFVDQTTNGFVGDGFPLRPGTTLTSGTPPTPAQFAPTVADYLGIPLTQVQTSTYNALFEQNGYDWNFTTNSLKPASQRFQGFTMGPGYYGKTFYMWPPDPRTPVGNIGNANYVAGDWRQRFFSPVSGSGQSMKDNSVFWSGNGRWKPQNVGPSASYLVNYNAILAWLIKGPQTLPTSLRSGRVVYYNSIPTSIPIDPTTGMCLPGATPDQCFWRDYIDYVLGAGRYIDAQCMDGANSINGNLNNGANLFYNNPSNTMMLPRITPLSALAGTNPTPYMFYADNPVHPRMQFWFGPLSMIGYLQYRVNYYPGTCYESPCWQLKAGINAVLSDIQNNHPNDMASLIYFSSSPGYSTSRVSMGKSYSTMQNCLYYPYNLISSLGDVTATMQPFTLATPTSFSPAGMVDNTDTIIPNSGTETCPQMGFMVAYNEFGSASSSTTTFTGRTGALKVAVFETDGVPNATCDGSLTMSGPGSYYYNGIGNPSVSTVSLSLNAPPKTDALAVVQQIVASTTANPPGYSTTRNPAQVHAIAFGELFEPATPSAQQPAALQFLTAVQIYGNTSPTPPGSWFNNSLDYNAYYAGIQPYKIITGTASQRIANLTQCMQLIMQNGVQVALIQ